MKLESESMRSVLPRSSCSTRMTVVPTMMAGTSVKPISRVSFTSGGTDCGTFSSNSALLEATITSTLCLLQMFSRSLVNWSSTVATTRPSFSSAPAMELSGARSTPPACAAMATAARVVSKWRAPLAAARAATSLLWRLCCSRVAHLAGLDVVHKVGVAHRARRLQHARPLLLCVCRLLLAFGRIVKSSRIAD
jgi:hypothetical protein